MGHFLLHETFLCLRLPLSVCIAVWERVSSLISFSLSLSASVCLFLWFLLSSFYFFFFSLHSSIFLSFPLITFFHSVSLFFLSIFPFFDLLSPSFLYYYYYFFVFWLLTFFSQFSFCLYSFLFLLPPLFLIFFYFFMWKKNKHIAKDI